jgi:hypothetical protein
MYEKICTGYDLVVASRYVKGGRKVGGPVLKYLLSRMANQSLHFFTGIPTHDLTNAFIMYKKAVLENISIRSTGGFEITMELLAKAYILNYKITEVPTINRERSTGTSKFSIAKWIGKYLYWYMYILVFSLVRRVMDNYERDVNIPFKQDS